MSWQIAARMCPSLSGLRDSVGHPSPSHSNSLARAGALPAGGGGSVSLPPHPYPGKWGAGVGHAPSLIQLIQARCGGGWRSMMHNVLGLGVLKGACHSRPHSEVKRPLRAHSRRTALATQAGYDSLWEANARPMEADCAVRCVAPCNHASHSHVRNRATMQPLTHTRCVAPCNHAATHTYATVQPCSHSHVRNCATMQPLTRTQTPLRPPDAWRCRRPPPPAGPMTAGQGVGAPPGAPSRPPPSRPTHTPGGAADGGAVTGWGGASLWLAVQADRLEEFQ